jgi:site-specific DNA-methyltransferase (adenine-specific)
MTLQAYNPDVLSCLANLSNDEVFTPPNIVNQILDLLPIELWSNKEAKFLDPVSKSGVFLREITKRLLNGLENEIPDLQERLDHIFKNQIYGMAITELTSLLSRRTVYCSKKANNDSYSVATVFDNEAWNIIFDTSIRHTWQDGKCIHCGANQEAYDREDELESHAYAFIHTANPLDLFNLPHMKFDVIIGNPPYQLNDWGHGKSAAPLYHKFIEQAKRLSPRYLSMIIPARWYAGGKWLDEFRSDMLHDKRIRKLVDFENSSEVFPGVDIAGGICYFLWDRENPGDCEMTNFYEWKPTTGIRDLSEFSILIRHAKSLPIIRKVLDLKLNDWKLLSERVSSRKPFGLPTNYVPTKLGIPCHFTQRIWVKFAAEQDVMDEANLLNKWKLLIPPAPIAGQTDFSKPVWFYTENNTRIARPGECCTESYIVACAAETEAEIISFRSYLFTKIVRFLLLQTVISQHVTKGNFSFIPDLWSYSWEYSDEILRREWWITDEEWVFIDSRIR